MVGVEEHHMVRLSISSQLLDHEIWVPFMKRDLLTADRILTEVERVIQSNDEWMFEDFNVLFVHAPLPAGQGFARGIDNLQSFLEKKRCFIQIPKDNSNLCCARAIVTARARIDKHEKWNSIRVGCKIQETLAKELQAVAQIPEGTACGKPEWDKFQTVLGNNYQLVIYSKDFFNTIVYEGAEFSENQLNVYHSNNHFSVITTVPGFLEKSYYCKRCHVGYNKFGTHTCENGCKSCHSPTRCDLVVKVSCETCNRYFMSHMCYQHHLVNRLCEYVKCCEKCGKTHHKYHNHVCGQVYCKVCKQNQPQDHKCYIQPCKPQKARKQNYIFYDF